MPEGLFRSETTVLVTGATSGIGREVAVALAARGYRVFATGRDPAALAALAGPNVTAIRLDVTSADSIAAAAAEVDARTDGAGLDVLINNAGYGWAAPAVEMSDADLRAMFDTNVFGLMAVVRAFAPKMIARGSGRILNVSSVGGRMTFPLFGGYNGSKYAVESLSDALRLELGPLGVKVVLIEPGGIRSNFAATSMKGVARYRSDGSPWAGVYQRAEAFLARAEANAAGPEVITRIVERAITARRPAARYVAPFAARVQLWLMATLPTRWTDALLSRMFELNRARSP